MALGIIEVASETPIPGTELLINERSDALAGVDPTQLKRVMYKGAETILIPQPADDDPNDPLLWPRWKKEVAYVVLFFSNIIFAAVPGPVLAPVTFALAGILGVPLTKIAELSGYQLLIVGAIGPLVSVLAQKYGKRPQFLFAAVTGTLGTVICIIGSQLMHYPTLLAGRMVQGLGTTAWESLSLSAMGDMFYLHERGLRTAITYATLTCTPSMVSIVSGSLTQRYGWTNLFIASLPFDFLALIGTVFFLPETQYKRPPMHQQASSPSVRKSVEDEKREASAAAEPAVAHISPTASLSQKVTAKNEPYAPAGEKGDGAEIDERAAAPFPSKQPLTYLQTLAPWSGTVYTTKPVWHLLGEIFVHLINPAVIWIHLVSAVLIALFVVTAYITSQIFSPPPYNLNAAQNGYFYTGSFVGGALAIVGGPICDWTARKLAALNGGVYEAEFRLPINALGLVCCVLGWFLFMWDVDHPRPNGYYLGSFCYGVVGFGISLPSTSAGLYILDSFPRQATEVFILQMMIKNFIFYAFSTMINTWAGRDGPGFVFRTWGIVSICLILTTIPMYIFGKMNRKFMSDLYAKYGIFRTLA